MRDSGSSLLRCSPILQPTRIMIYEYVQVLLPGCVDYYHAHSVILAAQCSDRRTHDRELLPWQTMIATCTMRCCSMIWCDLRTSCEQPFWCRLLANSVKNSSQVVLEDACNQCHLLRAPNTIAIRNQHTTIIVN